MWLHSGRKGSERTSPMSSLASPCILSLLGEQTEILWTFPAGGPGEGSATLNTGTHDYHATWSREKGPDAQAQAGDHGYGPLFPACSDVWISCRIIREKDCWAYHAWGLEGLRRAGKSGQTLLRSQEPEGQEAWEDTATGKRSHYLRSFVVWTPVSPAGLTAFTNLPHSTTHSYLPFSKYAMPFHTLISHFVPSGWNIILIL